MDNIFTRWATRKVEDPAPNPMPTVSPAVEGAADEVALAVPAPHDTPWIAEEVKHAADWAARIHANLHRAQNPQPQPAATSDDASMTYLRNSPQETTMSDTPAVTPLTPAALSTATIAPAAPSETPAQKVQAFEKKALTWLQKAGAELRNVLHIGGAVAQVAEPFVDTGLVAAGLPEVAALYNGTVGLFVGSEAAFGAAPGAGTAKLAASVPAVTANLKTWADQNGFSVIDADVQKWASAFVDTLNLLPITKKTS